jgi:hypothetical protein
MDVLLETVFPVARAAAVSGKRLGKHVPVPRQHILNATVELQQWKNCVFYVVRTEML